MSTGTIEKPAEATATKKTYRRGLPMPHGAFQQFRVPDELAVTEVVEGRTLVAPPEGMDDSSAYRWRVAQVELQQLVENWEPLPVNPPAVEPEPKRGDRDSLRAMLASEGHYRDRLLVVEHELVVAQRESELARIWETYMWAKRNRERAQAAAMVNRAELARSWLLEDAPPELRSRMQELQTAKKLARYELSETGQVNSDRIDWLKDRVETLKRMPSLDHGQAYELRTLEPELDERLETLAKVEAEMRDLESQMLNA